MQYFKRYIIQKVIYRFTTLKEILIIIDNFFFKNIDLKDN